MSILKAALDAMTFTFHVYVDRKGEWRWRLKARNGQIVADSAEGYSSKANCLNGINLLKINCAGATIVEDGAAK